MSAFKDYKRSPDAFALLTEAEAGALIGVIIGALVLWDIYRALTS